MERLQKKYGLLTAIAMVVGVVIGSGVFFKADDVLTITDGNLIVALAAWVIGAFAMIFGALVFAEFAGRIEKSNGLVDYFEEAYGKLAGYLVGWFNGVLYFSPLSAILAWVSSLYTMILLGSDDPTNSPATWGVAVTFLLAMYVMNTLAPKLAGRFQVATTFIKLIPLILVAVFGLFSGIINGVTMENFSHAAGALRSQSGTFAAAVVATAFAYEGWIIAVTLNSEIKDAKKNLPKALVFGTILVFVVYVSYFLGIAGVLPTEAIIAQGDSAVTSVSAQLFGTTAAAMLTVFVIISCLGTLNGLVMSCIRIPFSLAVRNHGPMPKVLSKVNKRLEMPLNAALFATLLSSFYLFLWYGSLNNFFGRYIAMDEIPIVMVYGLYMLLYIWYMVTYKDLPFFKRYVVPIFALMGAGIILYGGITNPSIGLYMLISLAVLLLGGVFYRKRL